LPTLTASQQPTQEYTVRRKLEVQGNTAAKGSNFHRLLTKLKKKEEEEEAAPLPSPGRDQEKPVKKDLKQVLGVQAEFVISKGMKGGVKKQSET